MKIGIVSRTRCINYGANLQALALQETLKSLGFDAEYIDYNVVVPVKGPKKILSFGYDIVKRFLGYSKREQRTKDFWQHINFSDSVSDKSGLDRISEQYQLLLCGSDQIWNPRYFKTSNGLYLLDFGKENTKRASYASSFGIKKLPEWYSPIVTASLSRFETLSCRENEGINILDSLNLVANRHIDPTFLLTKEDWQKYYDNEPLIKGKYICCYVMPGATELNNYILRIADKMAKKAGEDCKVVVLGEKEYKGWLSNRKYMRTAGPSEFLNVVDHADYILTSSFHGTCFATIFRKQFNSVLDKRNPFNSRIEDLLRNLGLEKRIMYMDANCMSIDESVIDYGEAGNLIQREIESAKKYLSEL